MIATFLLATTAILSPQMKQMEMMNETWLTKYSASLAQQAGESQTLVLDLNSLGGYITVADKMSKLIDFFEIALGKRVVCRVGKGQAAYSAAFLLLSLCRNRAVDPEALLMWHPMRVVLMGSFLAEQLGFMSLDMMQHQAKLNAAIERALRRPFSELRWLYSHETVVTGAFFTHKFPKFVTFKEDL